MTHWNKRSVIEAAKIAGVEYEVHPKWDDVNPYGTSAGWTSQQSSPVGIVWHHTGCMSRNDGNDAPSLNYVLNPGEFAGEARACNALLDRQGKFHFISAYACYHAGLGGPCKVGGAYVPKDAGNRWLIGVEIEAHSSEDVVPYRPGRMNGVTDLQMVAMSKWCAALCDLMNWPTTANIRHSDWTDGGFDGNPVLPTLHRKVDVALPLTMIRKNVREWRENAKPTPVPVKPPVVPTKPVEPPVTGKPQVQVHHVQPDRRNPDVLLVQKALSKEVGLDYSSAPGLFGPKTRIAWMKWELKAGVKFPTGIPTLATLNPLGERYGFTVTR
jgi:hypothetical protein